MYDPDNILDIHFAVAMRIKYIYVSTEKSGIYYF